jgi:hypothetical protein
LAVSLISCEFFAYHAAFARRRLRRKGSIARF